MADDFEQIGNFLSRWSRRKLEKTGTAKDDPPEAPAAERPAEQAEAWQTAPPEPGAPIEETKPEEPLPGVEELTPDSDFTRFMQPKVDPGVKTAALKKLFKDPHFNVMDGLDTYIEDYSLPDPIPAAMMKTMYQAREHLFSPEEKALADAADAAEAAERVSADEIEKELQALDAPSQTTESGMDTQARPGAEPDTDAPDAGPPAPDRKDA